MELMEDVVACIRVIRQEGLTRKKRIGKEDARFFRVHPLVKVMTVG